MVFMESTSLISTRSCHSFKSYTRNGDFSPLGSSKIPYSSSSPSFHFPSSIHRGHGFGWFSFSVLDINNIHKHPSLWAQAMGNSQGKTASPEIVFEITDEPDHLLFLVHGLVASPSDWTYIEAELKRRLGRNFLIYVSSCNIYSKTLTGIDKAGKRLAAEILEVIKKTQSLKRISFLAHSLGGLFVRYAIAALYLPNSSTSNLPDEHADSTISNIDTTPQHSTIAGLDPINFITLASPHLGVRGRNQLPFLFGVPILEKFALPLAPIVAGRTGSQLFLTDGEPNKRPLLLRMASDCEDGKYISALGSFRCRVIYANISYDHIVGWRTSSIRRESELINPPRQYLNNYKHIVNVEYCPPVLSDEPKFPPEAAKAKAAAQNSPSMQSTVEYHEIMEEEMICGLQRLGWKKVDVSFHTAPLPFLAHHNIHVKNGWLNSSGAGVVDHVADNLRQQEYSPLISSSL